MRRALLLYTVLALGRWMLHSSTGSPGFWDIFRLLQRRSWSRDVNIRLDRSDDPWCARFNDLLSLLGATQSVQEPTHDEGGILHVVVIRKDTLPTSVDVIGIGLSDHRLVRWLITLITSFEPQHVTQQHQL